MRHRSRWMAVAAAAALLATPGMASADPEQRGGGREQFPGEGVVDELTKQDDGGGGHLPARQENVELVGKAAITNPNGSGDVTGRVADVFAFGDYAYLTAYAEPTCENGGVHVMDISDVEEPKEVVDAFIPTSAGSYAGEGIQVIEIGKRDVLIHQNENCGAPVPGSSGGINLWDVTDPTDPQPLALHAGDKPDGVTANTVHSMYAWQDGRGRRAKTYVALVDNAELTDVDIMDISDPTNPVMVNDTLDLVELFGVDQESPAGLTSIFSHDMTVVDVGRRKIMTTNYWDGGYVLLDVTDPRPGKVTLVAESDYAELDEERLARGQEISPEGNAHQSELSPDRDFLLGTDEDFNPFRVVASIDTGQHAGVEYEAVQAGDTPPITDQQTITGPTTYVGDACAPLTDGTGTALVERGTCSFQVKLDNITAAGYSAGIVFNNTVGCDGLVTMAATGTIPYVFVSRTTGLQLLDQPLSADVCTQPTPSDGVGQASTIRSVFDGWGYVRLFQTDIPRRTGNAGTIEQVDTYAIEESQDPAFATGFGDLSVHEVAMDPRKDGLAYISYYAGGLRVVEYGEDGIEEVGVFIDEGGSNFWGVEVYRDRGETYVLASDRDFGLYILQYDDDKKREGEDRGRG